jgi:glyoxylase-like metal-dependent hydrolase (beta-lactamase superfamily II)
VKIYFHLSLEEFTNSYVIVNELPSVRQAIIIDPGKISPDIIRQLEDGNYTLTAVLVTHNHRNHVLGLPTLNKIYSPRVYAADYEIAGTPAIVLNGDGKISLAGLDISYFSVPGHSFDSMVFKIGNVMFTGDTLTSGVIGETSSKYSKKLLCDNIRAKIFSQTDDTVIMPGHGPPTTVGAEKLYNLDMSATGSALR